MSETKTMPDDVREAMKKEAARWMLSNFTNGKKELRKLDEWCFRFVRIHSTYLPGDTGANRRRLLKLVNAGVILKNQTRSGHVIAFMPHVDEAAIIINEVIAEYEAMGYVQGVMMDPIKVPA